MANQKPMNKSEIFNEIAERTGVSRKQISEVFDALGATIQMSISKSGSFVLPGLVKVSTIHKPATESKNRPNPFKPGEMMTVKARPARTLIKVKALKQLKEMANTVVPKAPAQA